MRISEDDARPEVAAARVQAPRSLWDPSYTEKSWITQWSTHRPIRLLPRLREKIEKNYPGTRLAITEYYYGGGADISGALAQADVLGIFGREGVFAAALWHTGRTDDRFIYAAFAMYRNYDGKGRELRRDGLGSPEQRRGADLGLRQPEHPAPHGPGRDQQVRSGDSCPDPLGQLPRRSPAPPSFA